MIGLSNVEEGDGPLYRQDWNWEEFKNCRSASAWKDDKKKALSGYNNKWLEEKMWKMKMVTGWERVLDWCEDITTRVYLVAVCEWLSPLRFENSNGPAPTWQLIGNVGTDQMIMSFKHMNALARFNSLGVEAYDYYDYDHFLDNKKTLLIQIKC
ncbi:hypothetical protein Hanom_Chr02g00141291 [Helianthus anomalus]